MKIYSTPTKLYYVFSDVNTVLVHEFTSVSDRDLEGKLYGTEIDFYTNQDINSNKVSEQFKNDNNVEIPFEGILYINIREFPIKQRGPGFGRNAKLGLDKEGLVTYIELDWNSSGATIPEVNYKIALQGIEYTEGEPTFRIT